MTDSHVAPPPAPPTPQVKLRVIYKTGAVLEWYKDDSDSMVFRNALGSFESFLKSGTPKYYRVAGDRNTDLGTIIVDWSSVATIDLFKK